MKKIYVLLLATIAMVLRNAERHPRYMMDDDTMTKNVDESFPPLLNGRYGLLRTWLDPIHRCGKYVGDNIVTRGTSTDAFYEFISYSRTPNSYRLRNFWDYSYKMVTQASSIIKDILEGKNTITDIQLEECYYLRGMTYFHLCRAYGRPYTRNPDTDLGIPIVSGTPNDPVHAMLPDRSTVKKTYEQAIKDLERAASLMTEDLHGEERCILASKEAAWAMLGRIYLYMSGIYGTPNAVCIQKSVEYAIEVIDSGKFSLLNRKDYGVSDTLEPENNSENIFVVKRIDSEFPGWDYYYTIDGTYSNIGDMSQGEMYASGKYLDLLNKAGQNDWLSKRYADIHVQFIEPQYVEDKTDKYVPVFRFIKNVYDASGNQVSFSYVQLRYTHQPDNSLTCNTIGTGHTTPLIFTPIDPTQRFHSINHQGYTYRGVPDYQMKPNCIYPMFYAVKYSRQGGKGNQLHSPIISRLDEVYPNHTETNVKSGNITSTMADANTIRERATVGGNYTSAQFTATTAKTLVNKERQLESVFEAERSYDMFHDGDTLTRRLPGPYQLMIDIPATDYRVVYSIPQSAINAYKGNPEQNPSSN